MRCYIPSMRLQVVAVVCASALGLALTTVACGAASSQGANPFTQSGTSCITSVRGTRSRVNPQNSGYTCEEIASILLVLPNSVGKWPIDGSSPSEGEVCQIYPESKLPLEIECRRGPRHFAVVAISKPVKH